MKFRTTLILLGVFVILLAVVLSFESKGKKAAAEKDEAEQLVDIAAADVRKLTLRKDEETITIEKDEAGEWLIVEPLAAGADTYEVDGLVNSFASLRFERIVDESPDDLSLFEIPKTELTLWVEGHETPIRLLVGMENPLDNTLFAKREDEERVVLLSSHLKASLEKTTFDFRVKEIFDFETADVQSIKLRAGDLQWEASKTEEDWLFTDPVNALARTSDMTSLLNSLSNLRAKEFVSEDKKLEDVRASGLDKPGYEVTLSLPAENKDITFSFHKAEDKFYAMSSEANKIILFEGTLLDDMGKEISELREKKVADFFSWEADRISIRRGDWNLTAVKEEVEDVETWYLDLTPKREAEKTKVEDFIRKIGGLEASEFIDSPEDPAEFGLDSPKVEIRIRTTGSGDEITEVTLFIGAQDEESNLVVVKNDDFDYLFRLDASFLQDIPEKAEDWQVQFPDPLDKNKDEQK
jgi:hypothetical protein